MELPFATKFAQKLLFGDVYRMNNYTIKMAEKLFKYGIKREDKKFNSLFRTLSIHSKAYRMIMLSNTEPSWYKI